MSGGAWLFWAKSKVNEKITIVDFSKCSKLESIGPYFLDYNNKNIIKCKLPSSILTILPDPDGGNETTVFTYNINLKYLETPILGPKMYKPALNSLTTLVLNGNSVIDNLTLITAPNPNLKIYVKEDLIQDYKSKYPSWVSKFYTIENDLIE